MFPAMIHCEASAQMLFTGPTKEPVIMQPFSLFSSLAPDCPHESTERNMQQIRALMKVRKHQLPGSEFRRLLTLKGP